jgi:DNA-binding cell septation regulator SpoVG
MQITDIKIELIKDRAGLIGFANIVIDSNIYLSSIGIHKKLNKKEYRLTYPKKQDRGIFHPINKEASLVIENAVFKELKKVMKYDRYNSYDNTNY